MKPWTERIPAAIATGEKWLGKRAWRLSWVTEKHDYEALTAGEVALAKELWEHYRRGLDELALGHYLRNEAPSLIAYCEKIERLSHD